MITIRLLLLSLLLNGTAVVTANETETLECIGMRAARAPLDSPEYRKYAPDREIDILHLALDITPDFKQRTIVGKTTITFKPIAKPLRELRLDAVDLKVQSVSATEKIEHYQATDKNVIVNFQAPIAAEKEVSITINYSGQPDRGIYFRTPEMGYKDGEAHLFTQGEDIDARYWFPCYDYPNEKFTSEIICHVPDGMIALSNGRLLSEQKDASTGLTAFHWKQEKPHVSYLISLVAGYFKKIEDAYRDIPLAFYTLPSEIEQASSSFRDTKDAMAYFEKEIGVPYPWAKYDQVAVNDFVAGGMENTSITTLTDHTLFTSATENIRTSQGLMAHELAHQWFGDLVTCKDWSHVWLNEGFATYYAHLYDGQKNGRDQFLYGIYSDAKGIVAQTNDPRPIVFRQYDKPIEQFSYLAYSKGGWVLHMLRSQLGEELYRRCIKTYLERHQFGNVVTEDLNHVMEELSGRSYDQFFDQWVYHAHHPELDVNYSWDAAAKQAKISIAQKQALGPNVLLFKFPLAIRFKTRGSAIDRSITVQQKTEDFYFDLPEAPEIVRLDPELSLLAKIQFNLPEPMLYAQLADRTDMLGRMLAVEQLAAKGNHTTIAKLKEALKGDSFYGVRVEAAQALRTIHTDEALAALAEGMEQPDARVRLHVVRAVSGFFGDEAYRILRSTVEREKNPEIISVALKGMAAYAKPQDRESLQRYLNSDSYRNGLAEAALAAIRVHDDASYIAPLQQAMRDRQAAFTSAGLAQALDALAYLARNETNKDSVRTFLLEFAMHSKKQAVQLGAINALGTLGDPKAIAALQTFAGANKESPERSAAERAIEAIRAGRKSTNELKDLRNEVMELKKDNRELKKDVEELKKKLAIPQTPIPPTTKRSRLKK